MHCSETSLDRTQPACAYELVLVLTGSCSAGKRNRDGILFLRAGALADLLLSALDASLFLDRS